MNREQLAEALSLKIDALMAANASSGTPEPLVRIAAELRTLPCSDFRSALRDELLERAGSLELAFTGTDSEPPTLSFGRPETPSFSQPQFAALPADPRNFLFSFLSHVAVVAFIASGIWVGHVTVVKHQTVTSDLTFTPLPLGDIAPQGGGGGGDHSKVQASRGTPPEFSDQQKAPAAIVVRNETPKLPAPATVLGPPDLKLPQSNQIGDLFSPNIVMPSNGTGSRGGIGDNSGTGVGTGIGGGVGPGYLAGYGDRIYAPGKGVTAPHAVYDPDPEYSDEARRAKYQGNVVLSVIVDPTGHVRDVRVARSLGMGLDEKAIEAVQKWKFAPGMKDGHPVSVQVSVEVNFRLY